MKKFFNFPLIRNNIFLIFSSKSLFICIVLFLSLTIGLLIGGISYKKNFFNDTYKKFNATNMQFFEYDYTYNYFAHSYKTLENLNQYIYKTSKKKYDIFASDQTKNIIQAIWKYPYLANINNVLPNVNSSLAFHHEELFSNLPMKTIDDKDILSNDNLKYSNFLFTNQQIKYGISNSNSNIDENNVYWSKYWNNNSKKTTNNIEDNNFIQQSKNGVKNYLTWKRSTSYVRSDKLIIPVEVSKKWAEFHNLTCHPSFVPINLLKPNKFQFKIDSLKQNENIYFQIIGYFDSPLYQTNYTNQFTLGNFHSGTPLIMPKIAFDYLKSNFSNGGMTINSLFFNLHNIFSNKIEKSYLNEFLINFIKNENNLSIDNNYNNYILQIFNWNNNTLVGKLKNKNWNFDSPVYRFSLSLTTIHNNFFTIELFSIIIFAFSIFLTFLWLRREVNNLQKSYAYLKSIGYKNITIALSFLGWSFLLSFFSIIVGLIVAWIYEAIIYGIYKAIPIFLLNKFNFHLDSQYIFVVFGVIFFLTFLISIIIVMLLLRKKTLSLLKQNPNYKVSIVNTVLMKALPIKSISFRYSFANVISNKFLSGIFAIIAFIASLFIITGLTIRTIFINTANSYINLTPNKQYNYKFSNRPIFHNLNLLNNQETNDSTQDIMTNWSKAMINYYHNPFDTKIKNNITLSAWLTEQNSNTIISNSSSHTYEVNFPKIQTKLNNNYNIPVYLYFSADEDVNNNPINLIQTTFDNSYNLIASAPFIFNEDSIQWKNKSIFEEKTVDAVQKNWNRLPSIYKNNKELKIIYQILLHFWILNKRTLFFENNVILYNGKIDYFCYEYKYHFSSDTKDSWITPSIKNGGDMKMILDISNYSNIDFHPKYLSPFKKPSTSQNNNNDHTIPIEISQFFAAKCNYKKGSLIPTFKGSQFNYKVIDIFPDYITTSLKIDINDINNLYFYFLSKNDNNHDNALKDMAKNMPLIYKLFIDYPNQYSGKNTFTKYNLDSYLFSNSKTEYFLNNKNFFVPFSFTKLNFNPNNLNNFIYNNISVKQIVPFSYFKEMIKNTFHIVNFVLLFTNIFIIFCGLIALLILNRIIISNNAYGILQLKILGYSTSLINFIYSLFYLPLFIVMFLISYVAEKVIIKIVALVLLKKLNFYFNTNITISTIIIAFFVAFAIYFVTLFFIQYTIKKVKFQKILQE